VTSRVSSTTCGPVREPRDPAGKGDGARVFARELRLRLLREHLDRNSDDGLINPATAVSTIAASVQALEHWHASGKAGQRPPGRPRWVPFLSFLGLQWAPWYSEGPASSYPRTLRHSDKWRRRANMNHIPGTRSSQPCRRAHAAGVSTEGVMYHQSVSGRPAISAARIRFSMLAASSH
jgi:hypothetical protein